MPVPALSAFGVLPPGRHDCTLDEIGAAYTTNAHRAALWADFQLFLVWAAGEPAPSSILIDGGFTSDKADPKDIDVVFDLTGCSDIERDHWIVVWATERLMLMNTYRVDFWFYAPSVAMNDLRAFFEYVRPEEAILRGMGPGDLKGLLRVIP